MHDPTHDQQPLVDFADADAVCEACDMVNPEGTLICKQCGNNLRDQRARRVAQGIMKESEHDPGRNLRFLTGAFAALGILVILWLALNAEQVLSSLSGIDTTSTAQNLRETFWEGDDAELYQSMLNELLANPVNESVFNNIPAQTSEGGSLDGRYVLRRAEGFGPPLLGQALVRTEDGIAFFVAQMQEDIEIRGALESLDPARPSSIHCAVRIDGDYSAAFGFAQRNEDGSYTCLAQTGEESEYQTALIFRLE